MSTRWIARFLLILVLLFAAYLYKKYRVAPKLNLSSLKLSTLQGQPVGKISEGEGVLFISFFATWCGPCLQEIPYIQEAQKVLKNENVKFILVSDEPLTVLNQFKERQEVDLEIFKSETSLSKYGIFTIPTTYIFDSDGQLKVSEVGFRDWSSENEIKKIRGLTRP